MYKCVFIFVTALDEVIDLFDNVISGLIPGYWSERENLLEKAEERKWP